MSKRIMVVEDESIVRLDISMMLEDAGYDVVAQVGNGESAVEQAFSQNPDLIVMDIKMPKLNGLKASEIISKRTNIPILLLTAYSQREYIDKAKQANILGYLVKPVKESSLIPAVEIALQQAEKAKVYRQEVEDMKDELTGRKMIEKAKGLIMEKFHVPENTAYNKMRKISMDKQVSLEIVAKKVLLKYKS
ncbi:ANTAR domain-containing response regulator [Rossellomorea vietnamensis]|uniref:ANTAR domain-containing response regulator n=1 Tax=Rossellomorea vietnamensis TaxID=218284 RepID=UPI001E575A34|nr:response regulator [Rossellomorea vietnamensis]MCC5803844.1 response regulator [Rossellomorea vietnamensis]